MNRMVGVVALAFVGACSSKDTLRDNDDAFGSTAQDQDDTTPANDTPPPNDPSTPPPPAWPALTELAGIMHLHSPYSHDACDGDGLPEGKPNAQCLADLREGLCASRIDVVSLTDHPNFMTDYSIQELVLYDAAKGDTLVSDNGAPVANRMKCPDGRQVLVLTGYEDKHTMPLGMRQHTNPAYYDKLVDDIPAEEARALVDGLKATGAVVAIAHSEGEDLSAARIIDAGVEAMEWYNPHGNFKAIMGDDVVSGDPELLMTLFNGMTGFLQGSGDANADLVYLSILNALPVAGFDKWREVHRTKNVTGILGTDAHQNIAVEPVCNSTNEIQQAICVAAAEATLPPYMAGFATGGAVMLTDGKRMDNFSRMLRWLQNRVLVENSSHAGFTSAVRRGRVYGVFTVFGDARGVQLRARAADGTPIVMGDSSRGPLSAEIILPARPVPIPGGASFTTAEADTMVAKVRLFRTTSTKTELFAERTGLAGTWTLSLTQPGAYHVEVWVTPNHLRTALSDQADLADHDYLWIITNPIRVTE